MDINVINLQTKPKYAQKIHADTIKFQPNHWENSMENYDKNNFLGSSFYE